MRDWRKLLIAALIIGAVGAVQAQPDGDDDDSTGSLGLGGGSQAKLTPREMERQSAILLSEMRTVHRKVVELQQAARKSKDIIKLNCVNDKLLQVKQLLNIAEGSRASMVEAIAASNEGERYHHFTSLTVAADKVKGLRDEAEACIGQEMVFLGPTAVDVDKPPIVDDPTKDDPFNLGGFEIERPTYATPYL
jgi:hypothetical protein